MSDDQNKVNEDELKCVWGTGSECSGEVKMRKMFSQSIEIPVCEAHIKDHECIVRLHQNGYDVEEVLNKGPEYWRKEYLIIQMSGLDKSDDSQI